MRGYEAAKKVRTPYTAPLAPYAVYKVSTARERRRELEVGQNVRARSSRGLVVRLRPGGMRGRSRMTRHPEINHVRALLERGAEGARKRSREQGTRTAKGSKSVWAREGKARGPSRFQAWPVREEP